MPKVFFCCESGEPRQCCLRGKPSQRAKLGRQGSKVIGHVRQLAEQLTEPFFLAKLVKLGRDDGAARWSAGRVNWA